MSNSQFYVPSGNYALRSFVICLALSFTIVLVLGVLYSILVWYIPFVYFNFILTGVFGALLGILIFPIVRLGHVRSRKIEWLFMVLICLSGLYFSWAAHMTLVYNMSGTGTLNAETSFRLEDFVIISTRPLAMIKDIYESSWYGVWSIGSIPIRDVAIWTVWILEATIIMIAIWEINRKWSLLPYSEVEGNWCGKEVLNKKLTLYRGMTKFIDAIRENDISVLTRAPNTDSTNMEYTELAIYSSTGDNHSFIAFFNKTVKRDSNGKQVQVYKRASDFVTITQPNKAELINHFGIGKRPGVLSSLFND